MSPYEITLPGGSVEHMSEESGALWLRRVTTSTSTASGSILSQRSTGAGRR